MNFKHTETTLISRQLYKKKAALSVLAVQKVDNKVLKDFREQVARFEVARNLARGKKNV